MGRPFCLLGAAPAVALAAGDPSPAVRALPLVMLLVAGVTVAALYALVSRRRRNGRGRRR